MSVSSSDSFQQINLDTSNVLGNILSIYNFSKILLVDKQWLNNKNESNLSLIEKLQWILINKPNK